MKRTILSLTVALIAAVSVNAQVLIGGALGLGGQVGSKSKVDGKVDSKANDQFYVDIAPRVGYLMLDGKLEVGGMIDFAYNQDMTFMVNSKSKVEKDYKTQVFTIMVTPYVSYYFLQRNRFALGIRGGFGLGSDVPLADKYYKNETRSTSEAKDLNQDAKDNLKDADASNFSWLIGVQPVMSYDVTNHLRLELAIPALGFYAMGDVDKYTTKDAMGESVDVSTSTSIVNLGLFSSQSQVQLSLMYKF